MMEMVIKAMPKDEFQKSFQVLKIDFIYWHHENGWIQSIRLSGI